MKKIYLIVTVVLILVCGTLIFAITDDSKRADQPFRIMYLAGSRLGPFAHAYKFAHPDEEVEVSFFDDYDEYVRELTNMLMAGSAPDVFDVMDEMLMQYGGTVYFEDLAPYMENDPDFDESLYYMNVIEAFKIGDKLPVFPSTFYQYYQGINSDFAQIAAQEINSRAYYDTAGSLDIFFSLPEAVRAGYYCDINLSPVGSLLKTSYLDLPNQTADFVNEDFIDLIEKSRDYIAPEKNRYLLLTNGNYDAHFRHPDRAFALFSSFSPTNYLPFKEPYTHFDHTPEEKHRHIEKVNNDFSDLKPFATQDGRQIISAYLSIGVYSGSYHKDKAWKLIKYSLSPGANKVDDFLSYTCALNKEVNERLFRETLEGYMKSYNHNRITDEMRNDIEEAVKRLLVEMEMPKFVFYSTTVADLDRVLDDFLYTDESGYETAVRMQRMAEIYFIEKE